MSLAPLRLGPGALASAPTGNMKAVATGTLVVMAGVFALATALLDRHPAWGFVRAFAEAAMVGGLADWFAVTALFRHPLGLPIPHTAIIPKNKDRIGDALAAFLRSNFLTPSVVARRMRRIDVAGAAGRFLQAPPQGGRMREGASRLAADMLAGLDDRALGGMVKTAVSQRIRAFEIAPVLGTALGSAIGENRHIPMLDAGVAWAAKALDANEGLIRAMVHQRANWILKLAGLDTKLADSIIAGLKKLADDMVADPDHPIRLRAQEGLAELADKLQTDGETRAKVEEIKGQLLDNPAVAAWLDDLWRKGRTALLRALEDPERALAGRFGETLRGLGRTLETDGRLNGAVNMYARRAAVGTVASYGDGIVTLVSDTIRGWDAGTVTQRLEGAVGRDLQYIRINGTVVGGLVGLLIHTVEEVL